VRLDALVVRSLVRHDAHIGDAINRRSAARSSAWGRERDGREPNSTGDARNCPPRLPLPIGRRRRSPEEGPRLLRLCIQHLAGGAAFMTTATRSRRRRGASRTRSAVSTRRSKSRVGCAPDPGSHTHNTASPQCCSHATDPAIGTAPTPCWTTPAPPTTPSTCRAGLHAATSSTGRRNPFPPDSTRTRP
jgi:hypothetical protein